VKADVAVRAMSAVIDLCKRVDGDGPAGMGTFSTGAVYRVIADAATNATPGQE